jgi:hypothetical protein
LKPSEGSILPNIHPKAGTHLSNFIEKYKEIIDMEEFRMYLFEEE